MNDATYEIVRFFRDGDCEHLSSGLSLAEAKEHCTDPETSSSSCTEADLVTMTEERGPWFDGYREE